MGVLMEWFYNIMCTFSVHNIYIILYFSTVIVLCVYTDYCACACTCCIYTYMYISVYVYASVVDSSRDACRV